MYVLHCGVWSIIVNDQLSWLHGRKLESGVKCFSCSLVDGQQGSMWAFRFGSWSKIYQSLLVSTLLRDSCWVLQHMECLFTWINYLGGSQQHYEWLNFCKEEHLNECSWKVDTKHSCMTRTQTWGVLSGCAVLLHVKACLVHVIFISAQWGSCKCHEGVRTKP